MANQTRVIFFGTPKEVVPVLEQLTQHFQVVGVVTAPDTKVGRKQLLTPPEVKVFAQTKNIPVLQPTSLKDTQQELANLTPDIFVVAAYGKIIPQSILDIPKHGAVNIHPSLLPKYRGPTPIQTTLLHGDSESGITFIVMDAEMDHGPILHQLPFHIKRTDTFGWLLKNMFAQAAVILPHILESYIAGEKNPVAQDESQATYCKILTKEDGYFDIQNPPKPEALDQMIRGLYPWPNAWTKVQVKDQELRLKFLPEEKVQLEGKNIVARKDFINGYPELKQTLTKLFDE